MPTLVTLFQYLLKLSYGQGLLASVFLRDSSKVEYLVSDLIISPPRVLTQLSNYTLSKADLPTYDKPSSSSLAIVPEILNFPFVKFSVMEVLALMNSLVPRLFFGSSRPRAGRGEER